MICPPGGDGLSSSGGRVFRFWEIKILNGFLNSVNHTAWCGCCLLAAEKV